MSHWRWWGLVAAATALVAFALSALVHPYVGSVTAAAASAGLAFAPEKRRTAKNLVVTFGVAGAATTLVYYAWFRHFL